ncbi:MULTISPECIES: hypothetical protein [unclassified Enterococcus]|uniref:hypothetical protein n=1 Tax=unclassified Enterococcus TaxID=2608891 RepID=UPI001CE2063F|nr:MULTISPECIES: hypothetical protein [unclassified Enterococcus]MCA5013523.1 hypothetical protein [Enterococcus sp. S23]MCA5016773.1 hypothetical protein [Enterococcus sp. S22(2020)]
MDFRLINEQLIERTPHGFLTTVLTTEQEEDASIIFSGDLEEQFEQAVAFLSSAETLTLDDLKEWQANEFLVVAQTIDGDYIAGTKDQTFVIPVSLYKSDIELFDLFLSDFFIDYSTQKIHSSILPTYH